MTSDERQDQEPVGQPPDPDDPKDTDKVSQRRNAPGGDPGDTGFDDDAPGNFVDDTESGDVREPNEPG